MKSILFNCEFHLKLQTSALKDSLSMSKDAGDIGGDMRGRNNSSPRSSKGRTFLLDRTGVPSLSSKLVRGELNNSSSRSSPDRAFLLD